MERNFFSMDETQSELIRSISPGKQIVISFSSLLTKLAASKQEAKQSQGGQSNSDTFKLYINPATVGNATTSALQVQNELFF